MNMLALLTAVLLPTLPPKNSQAHLSHGLHYPVPFAFVAALISVAIRDFETSS